MRRALVLTSLILFGGAGAAWAVVPVDNVYVVQAHIAPTKFGTRHHPTPISSSLGWQVSTTPSGNRPANVRSYAIYYEGIDENTTLFVGCGTSTLSTPNATVKSCPKGSEIGSGFLIFMIGASGFDNAAYNGTCTSSLALFNGGYHDLTLFVYPGQPLPGQPAECTLPGGHVAIQVNISHSRRGITETFSMPEELLHPGAGFDTAVIQASLRMTRKERLVGGRSARHQVGLFESFFCPPNRQRQVAMVFTREDGVTQIRTTLGHCS